MAGSGKQRRGRGRLRRGAAAPRILAGGLWLILAGFPCLGQAGPEISAGSAALNSRGMDAYHGEEYGRAEELFRQAVEEDAGNYLAHYNLACVMILNRGDLPGIYRHLERSIELSPGRRRRLMEDPDLDVLRHHRRFQALMGNTLGRREDRERLMPKLFWAFRREDSGGVLEGEGKEARIAPVKMTSGGHFEVSLPGYPLRGAGRWYNSRRAVILVYTEGPLEGCRLVLRLEEDKRFRMTGPDGREWILFDIIDDTLENTGGGA